MKPKKQIIDMFRNEAYRYFCLNFGDTFLEQTKAEIEHPLMRQLDNNLADVLMDMVQYEA